MNTVWKVLTRKKILDPVSTEQSELGRVLNTFDLTALGVGSTLGVGVYVLAGQVAKETAGPAVVLSFLIATVASVFSGLCYAEFGARAPRAGSAYIYSYVCVGEFIAFVIGWNLILEYVIGSASVARGLSNYLDNLLNDTLKNTFIDIAPINVQYMSQYFDFFAFAISVILAIALAFGMKESSIANNIVTLLNLAVVIFVIIAGSIKADGKNWDLPKPQNRTDAGDGGFFPFGVEGMIKGAATCFYGFVGFDCIATTGEEVRNPKRAIPISIIVSLFIIFLAYFGTSTVVTLMLPYYDQDPNAPIPYAFQSIGWEVPKWIVAIGGIFGLCASLFGAMFPLPRIIYAMASDRLVFHFLSKVHPRFKTPVIGTLLAGILTGLMSALFELKQLVNMMSIGTLLAYTIVAASVLLLRFESDRGNVYELLRSLPEDDYDTYTDNSPMDEQSEETELMATQQDESSSFWKQIFNFSKQEWPSEVTEKIVKVNVCLYCVLCILIGLCAMYLKKPISQGMIWAIVLTAIVVCVTVLVVMSIATQPKSRKELTFKVPFVPLVPALSILINIYLMLMLDTATWIRFAVWMVIGIPAYFFSVRTPSDARNKSITSSLNVPNGKINGYTNNGYVPDMIEKSQPEQQIESPTAVLERLDEILAKEEAAIIDNNRKFSVETMSNASVSREENVEADVHCADVPLTPVAEAPPLVESSDVVLSRSVSVSSEQSPVDIAAIPPPAAAAETKENESVVTSNDPTEDTSSVASAVEAPESEKIGEVPESEKTEEPPIIPPPPPFMGGFNDLVNIPRPKFDLTGIKLRQVEDKTPISPPIDYSELPDSDGDDNLKFGSQEHKEFLEKLTKKLQQGYVPTSVTVNLSKTPSIKRESVPNEDVIADPINRDVAKQKFAEFLARTPSFTFVASPTVNGSKFDLGEESTENKEAENVDQQDYKEQHRKNMEGIFGSIKLRKADSFRDDSNVKVEVPEEQKLPLKNDLNSDRMQHKQNMDNIFKSIRLRKEDSFKAEQ